MEDFGAVEAVGGAEEAYLEETNWFASEQDVVKTESVGGLEHEGDIDFEELYGKGEIPTEADFEPVVTTHDAKEPDEGFENWTVEEESKEELGESAAVITHYTDGTKDYEVNEFEPWMDQDKYALMEPYEEE